MKLTLVKIIHYGDAKVVNFVAVMSFLVGTIVAIARQTSVMSFWSVLGTLILAMIVETIIALMLSLWQLVWARLFIPNSSARMVFHNDVPLVICEGRLTRMQALLLTGVPLIVGFLSTLVLTLTTPYVFGIDMFVVFAMLLVAMSNDLWLVIALMSARGKIYYQDKIGHGEIWRLVE